MTTGSTGAAGFALEHARINGVHVIRAAGRLVAGAGADHPAWAAAPALAPTTPVVMDLKGVTALDASGVGRLLRLRGSLARHGARLTIDAAGPRVRRVLTLSRLDAAFGLAPGVPSGDGEVAPTAPPVDPWCRCA